MDQVKIGKFVAELRRQKGWTQAQLGEMLGVTNKTVSRWENGNYMPELAIIPSLAEALGVSVNELMAGDRFAEEEYKREADAQLLKTMQLIEEIREIKDCRWLSHGLSCTALAMLIAGFMNVTIFDDMDHLLGTPVATSGWVLFAGLVTMLLAIGGIIYLNKGRVLLFIGAVIVFQTIIVDPLVFLIMLTVLLPMLVVSTTLDRMYFRAVDELLRNTQKQRQERLHNGNGRVSDD